MKKIPTEKIILKKGNHIGNDMWRAARLEGVVKNKGIKPIKKAGKGK